MTSSTKPEVYDATKGGLSQGHRQYAQQSGEVHPRGFWVMWVERQTYSSQCFAPLLRAKCKVISSFIAAAATTIAAAFLHTEPNTFIHSQRWTETESSVAER